MLWYYVIKSFNIRKMSLSIMERIEKAYLSDYLGSHDYG